METWKQRGLLQRARSALLREVVVDATGFAELDIHRFLRYGENLTKEQIDRLDEVAASRRCLLEKVVFVRETRDLMDHRVLQERRFIKDAAGSRTGDNIERWRQIGTNAGISIPGPFFYPLTLEHTTYFRLWAREGLIPVRSLYPQLAHFLDGSGAI